MQTTCTVSKVEALIVRGKQKKNINAHHTYYVSKVKALIIGRREKNM